LPRSLAQTARLEEWAGGDSPLHRRDARAKIVSAIVLLASIGATPPGAAARMGSWLALLAAAVLASGVPLAGALLRSAIILPFTLLFAAISWWVNQDFAFAATLIARSYLSALGAVLLMATTPLTRLLRGLQGLGVPAALVLVLQSPARYLQVIVDQGQRMRRAALSRAGVGNTRAGRRSLLQRAGGALAVLFGRSYAHAEGVHRAMLARGFRGEFHALRPARFAAADWVLIAATASFCLGVTFWIP
jgi:cobalt/nickel transport system permease protein